MYFAEDFIEKIRTYIDIVSLISEYTNLVKKGASSYIGKCPFHNEKTPSFVVSEDKQMYYCFGCGVGGNVITFMMEKENLSFGEAIESLAIRANIPLEYDNSRINNNREAFFKKDVIFDLYKKAARFYYYNLTRNTPEYVRQYLVDRGINKDSIKIFGLGFSPNSFNALYKYLRSEGVTNELLVESGLCVLNHNSGLIYDRFVNRLMFPIFSPTKKVIAFGGRVFGNENPKYLNSSENLIFHKSNNLYGLNLAKMKNHEYYILVEGYMDVIAMHREGFTNTVASLGTAFTESQAKLLKRYTDNIVIIYDSDNAGQKATLKASKILRDEGFSVKILELNGAKDPDEFLKKYGNEKLQNAITVANSDIWYKITKIQMLYDLNNLPEKIKFLEQISSIIANLQNSIEQQLYIDEISTRFNVNKSAIEIEIKKRIVNTKENKIVYENHSKKSDIEVDLLSVLYHTPTIYDSISEYVFPELFTEGVKRNIAISLINDRSIDTALLNKKYPNVEDQKIISSIIIGKDGIYKEKFVLYKIVTDAIKILNNAYYIEQLKNLSANPEKIQHLMKLRNSIVKLNIVPKNG
ncbi:DNA primase [Candidatus Epulonipiscium viviparus]|uniref:DNA primase n=1 Tax=Candidatus Epulonipiscium viviparus TaxID=420336 RepID=UPI00016C0A50|nr:DNA primase [Candidatus Epulopiscium viviparus]